MKHNFSFIRMNLAPVSSLLGDRGIEGLVTTFTQESPRVHQRINSNFWSNIQIVTKNETFKELF